MQKSLTAFVNTVLNELGNEVQHSAYQERTKLRHISGEKKQDTASLVLSPHLLASLQQTTSLSSMIFFQQRGVQK